MEQISASEEPSEQDQETTDRRRLARRFLWELKCALDREKDWRKEAKKAWREYTLGRKQANEGSGDGSSFAMFWSNVETQIPALFNTAPKPVIERRYKDKNPVARVASQLLERNTSYFTQPEYFDPKAEKLIKDFLIPGRATAWVRYVPYDDGENVTYEEVLCEPLHYLDFLTGQCSQWEECPWVARRVRMSKKDVARRFTPNIANALKYSSEADGEDEINKDDDAKQSISKADVWELWDKGTRTAYWLNFGFPDFLDSEPDPLNLENFFPCPQPLLATLGPDSLTPRPDYHLYADQLDYIDELTYRIGQLTKALALKGVRDAKYEELDRLIEESGEADLIPVENWSQFMQEGGLEKLVQFMPIEMIATVLKYLIELRESAKQTIYEVTGLSDIVRGASDPRETATAQRTKGQFASLRLQARQRKVTRFLREIYALKAEIIAEKFQPNTIAMIADVETFTPEDQQHIPGALQLLKNDTLRTFKIDIETTDTVGGNESEEKQLALEFVQTVGKVMEQTVKFAGMAPDFADVMGEMFLFVARKFRAGRSLEGKLEAATEQFLGSLKQQMQASQGKPSPEEMKAQADMQKAQMDAQGKQVDAQSKAQELALKQQELQAKLTADQAELQQKFAVEQEKLRLQEQELQADIAFKSRELALKESELGIKQAEQHNKNIDVATQLKMRIAPDGKMIQAPKRKRLNVERDPMTGMLTGAEMIEVDEDPQVVI